MTACSRLLKALQSDEQHQARTLLCNPCVYFSNNLDKAEFISLAETAGQCGLGFLPGDEACIEMRTNNCSARKHKAEKLN